MENVTLEISDDDILTIRCDLKTAIRPSNSKRSLMIACTDGNLPLWKNGAPHPKGIKVNLSVFRPFTSEEFKQVEAEARRRRLGL